jgi:hypothetical protein
MTQTREPAQHPPIGVGRREPSRGVIVALGAVIVVLAALATIVGLFARPDPVAVVTVRGSTAELFGGGVYRYDSVFAGAGNRGTDAVTLLVAIPLLVLCLLGSRRASLRWDLMLSGAVAWFLYVYLTMAVGSAFNPLFLVYVALFSAGLWMLGLVIRNVDLVRLAGQVDRLPRVGPAVLMLVSAVATAMIWLVPILVAQLAGDTPARLDSYTTVVTTAIDAAVITPAALVAGILILRRSAVGYLMAFPLVVLEAMLAPMIAAQTISQVLAGVSFQPGEIIGPLAGFVVLAGAAVWVQVSVLRVVEP